MNSVRGCDSPSRVDMLLEMVPQFFQPLRLLNSSHVNLHHSVVLRQTDIRLGNKTKIYEFRLVCSMHPVSTKQSYSTIQTMYHSKYEN